MVSGFVNSILAGDLPAMAGWCRGNIPVLSSGAAGSIPAPAPIFKRRGVDRMVKRVVSLLAAVFMVCASSFSVFAWDADSFVADSPNYYKMFPARMPSISTMAQSSSGDSIESPDLDVNSLFDHGTWLCDGFSFWVHCYDPGFEGGIPEVPDLDPYEYDVLNPLSGLTPSFIGSGTNNKAWITPSYSIPDSWNGADIQSVFVPGFVGASNDPSSVDYYSCDFQFDISSLGSFSDFEIAGYVYLVPELLFNGSVVSSGYLESIELVVDGDSVDQWVMASNVPSFTIPYTLISRSSSISSIALRFSFVPSSPVSYSPGNYQFRLYSWSYSLASGSFDRNLGISVLDSNDVFDGYTDEAQDSINQHDQIEADWVGQMDQNFNSLDLDTASYPSGLVSGFQLLSGIFMDIWNGLGDLHLIFTIPLTLGIVLVLIGRISKAVSNRSGRAEEKGDNSA